MRKTQKTAVVGSSVVALMAAGVAFAAWTTTGAGDGNATADYTNTDLVVTVSNINGLYPTGNFDVPFTVRNNNAYDVTLTKVTLENVTTSAPGCSPSAVISNAGGDGSLTDTDVVAKNNASATASRNFPITMTNSAQDACKGATFVVTLKAWGASS